LGITTYLHHQAFIVINDQSMVNDLRRCLAARDVEPGVFATRS